MFYKKKIRHLTDFQEHFFGGKGKGFIEHRLWTLQKKLPAELKKRRPRQKGFTSKGVSLDSEQDLLSEQELEEKVTIILYNFPKEYSDGE